MKFGFRTPSISKRIAARTSVKRIVKNELELKAPRGYGWITNPKKAMYNKVYNKTTTNSGCVILLFILIFFIVGLILCL